MGAHTTISISIPVELKERLEERLENGSYGDTSEYFRDLIRKDLEDAAVQRLRDLLAEGLASGPGRILDDDYRRDIRSRAGLPDK